MSKKSFGTPGAFGQVGTRRKASVMQFARALKASLIKNQELADELAEAKKAINVQSVA